MTPVPRWLQASLAELNSRCPEIIRMASFRPNIVVEGAQPWAEDSWKRVRIGSVQLDSVMPTGRCTARLPGSARLSRLPWGMFLLAKSSRAPSR